MDLPIALINENLTSKIELFHCIDFFIIKESKRFNIYDV